jgi:hypothetical protein
MAQVDHISTLAAAPAGSTSPDSITVANGDVWVAYTNGADSTGVSGNRSSNTTAPAMLTTAIRSPATSTD